MIIAIILTLVQIVSAIILMGLMYRIGITDGMRRANAGAVPRSVAP